MKNNRMALQIAVVGCLILFGCLTALAQDVRYNFAQGTDFSKYKTYKWVRVPGVTYPDDILDGQIRQAIDSQLSMKGLTKVTEDNADLYIAYQLSISEKTQWVAYGIEGGAVLDREGNLGPGMGTVPVTSMTIKTGTLVLDMYDVAAKQQVWRGDATKALHPSKNPQKNQRNLEKAMAKLLKNYPPPVK